MFILYHNRDFLRKGALEKSKNTTVWLTRVTIQKLRDLKEPKDTMEHVIRRLIASYEKEKKENE